MKIGVLIAFTGWMFTSTNVQGQTRKHLEKIPEKLLQEVQSGYMEISSQVTNRAMHKGENSSGVIKFHFIRTTQGDLNFVLVNENSVYIRMNGEEQSYYKTGEIYKERTNLSSPLNLGANGIFQAWFMDSLVIKLANNDRYKLKTEGERSVLSYTAGVDGFPNKVTIIEFGFNGIYPDYFRSVIPGKEVSQISVQRLTKLETNQMTQDDFHQILMETMAKVLKPAPVIKVPDYLESNPPFVNKAGDVFQGNWQKLNMLVVLPLKAPHLNLLMEELKQYKESYPNELLILPVSSTAGIWPQATKYPELTEVFTCEAGYLTRNQLNSDEVIILLVNDQRQILAEFKGFYPAQIDRLRQGVEKWVK